MRGLLLGHIRTTARIADKDNHVMTTKQAKKRAREALAQLKYICKFAGK